MENLGKLNKSLKLSLWKPSFGQGDISPGNRMKIYVGKNVMDIEQTLPGVAFLIRTELKQTDQLPSGMSWFFLSLAPFSIFVFVILIKTWYKLLPDCVIKCGSCVVNSSQRRFINKRSSQDIQMLSIDLQSLPLCPVRPWKCFLPAISFYTS